MKQNLIYFYAFSTIFPLMNLISFEKKLVFEVIYFLCILSEKQFSLFSYSLNIKLDRKSDASYIPN